ncbi:hypothetical protein DD598_27140 [Enterobacter cloacae complex sp. 2DZ2F16B1]|nr:hypothetical protein DD598_27140 [Enterobacter cloacae complex sp. 2DZ2F16B1]
MAATEAAKEAVWLSQLVGDLGIAGDAPILHCDSQSAIALARNPVFHAKTKHIEVRYHFIRTLLEEGQLKLGKVHTSENPADMFTKVVNKEKLSFFSSSIDIQG